MDLKPPATDGSYLGETMLNDGVVWTWNGTGWARGKRPGVLRKQLRPPRDDDEPRDEGDRG
jgi:hypothetical protein